MKNPDYFADITPDFDFDYWSKLAESDATAFETHRMEVIEDLITTAPPHLQQRLRGLQWRVDNIRKQSNNPMGACMRISLLMWDSLLGDNGLMDNLKRLIEASPESTKENAQIIPFRNNDVAPESNLPTSRN